MGYKLGRQKRYVKSGDTNSGVKSGAKRKAGREKWGKEKGEVREKWGTNWGDKSGM